jgi:hypothetical protein
MKIPALFNLPFEAKLVRIIESLTELNYKNNNLLLIHF